jgi:transcriptional regulator with XRE-family HTH domain
MRNFDYIAPEFEPIDEAEADLFAQEDFVADIQSILHRMMFDKGVSRADLAKRLGVSKPRISQYFAHDGSNLTARTLARIFHALGEQLELVCDWTRLQDATYASELRKNSITRAGGSVVEMRWSGGEDWCRSLNDNCVGGDDISALIVASRAREPVHFEKATG